MTLNYSLANETGIRRRVVWCHRRDSTGRHTVRVMNGRRTTTPAVALGIFFAAQP